MKFCKKREKINKKSKTIKLIKILRNKMDNKKIKMRGRRRRKNHQTLIFYVKQMHNNSLKMKNPSISMT